MPKQYFEELTLIIEYGLILMKIGVLWYIHRHLIFLL